MADQNHGGTLFINYLREKHPIIESYLSRHAPTFTQGSFETDDLERYLYDPLRHFTALGGKRVRPALVLLGCEAVGGNIDSSLSTAAAIENFQSAALIHDDIADKSELRRGKPCVYISEGVGIAINIGDLALTTVFATIVNDPALSESTKILILSELVGMEQMTLEGQALDLGWVRDQRWDITAEDYLQMANRKTAYYSGAVPLACGAICGGGSHSQIESLRRFGMQAGLAFQLQDDLLNLVGDPSQQGKDYRSDITEGKRTLVTVWSLAHLNSEEHAELLDILQAHSSETNCLARAVTLMEHSGAIEYVQDEAIRLAADAKNHLSAAGLTPTAYETLLSMADFFVGRSD